MAARRADHRGRLSARPRARPAAESCVWLLSAIRATRSACWRCEIFVGRTAPGWGMCRSARRGRSKARPFGLGFRWHRPEINAEGSDLVAC